MYQLVPVLALSVFVALFGLLLVFLASRFGPRTKPSAVKQSSYECGLEVEKSTTTKIPIKYYLTAILFILFDIEIIFMYPWALAFGDFIQAGHGLYIFSAMGVFLAIFVFGLFWEIKSRALDWD